MPATKQLRFNLLTQPWIPCVSARGEPMQVGLRELFAQANEIRDLSATSPLVRISLYRLLLAILYRTQHINTSEDWLRIRRGWDSDAILAYLERWEDRFDLFSEVHPFYQRADLDLGEKGRNPVTKFAPEFAAGGNKQLFDHSTDADPPAISAAEAAGYLLVAQHWSVGGGKSSGGRPNFTTAALARGACMIVLGDSLRDSLCLNLVPAEDRMEKAPRAFHRPNSDDRPVWERGGADSPARRAIDGPADYLTFESRYIRLLPEEDGSVRFCYIVQGEAIDQGDGASALIDPFHAWKIDKDKPHLPRTIGKERAVWRESSSLFAAVAEDADQESAASIIHLALLRRKHRSVIEQTVPVLVGGIAIPGGQPPPDLWCADLFRLPLAVVEDQDVHRELRDALTKADETRGLVRNSISSYAYKYLEHGSSGADKDAVGKFTNSLFRETDFWASLEAPFHRLLEGLGGDDSECAVKEWEATLRTAAIRTFEASLNTADNSGRHWRAQNAARGNFYSKLKEQFPKEESDEQ